LIDQTEIIVQKVNLSVLMHTFTFLRRCTRAHAQLARESARESTTRSLTQNVPMRPYKLSPFKISQIGIVTAL